MQPGGTLTYPADVYIGEKDGRTFKSEPDYFSRNYYYQISQGFGSCTFTFLVELMIWLLNSLYSIIPDYGLAIIIMVMIVRTLLHPITKKGQVNMVRMQQQMGEFAPKIEDIKKKFANDKARIQQETMKLYREHGINPAGQFLTCMPMVIQMPIWFALFLSLSNNIGMRHQPVNFTWINDLTAPDAMFEFSSPLPLIGATFNQNGSIVLRAERVGRDTLLAQIVQRVSEAQRSRAPIQRLADVVASWFVPAVLGVAVITVVAWGLAGPEPRLAHALVNAVAVLIIACPCALGLATPMSIMVGTGRGAQAGVLVRDAEALELLEKADVLVVDKTGTLTEGKPRLTSVVPASGHDEATVLVWASAVERGSEHPLAAAIVEGADDRGVPVKTATRFESVTGLGVAAEVDGSRVVIGDERMMREEDLLLSGDLNGQADALRAEGATVVYVAIGGEVAGFLAITDPIKESTPEALADLAREGLRIVMLTGDHATTASAVANRLGIEEFEAGVLPDRKSDVVQQLQSEGRVVAMAGDGINDAPALARAQIGIAMGTGTDIAMESAGVTLVKGDLRGIVKARRLSRATLRNIRQNLFFAFIYNAVGVPIAAGLLYPVFGLLLSPMIASAAMSFSSVSVIANALRLRKAAI